MSKYAHYVLGILVVVLIFLFMGNKTDTVSLGGNVYPQFSSAGVINSSSTLTLGTGGETIITHASNTGIWFSISNVGSGRVFWSLANSTTTSHREAGQFLSPVTSSTGASTFELIGYNGPVTCSAKDVNSAISFSYTGR